MLDFEVPDRVKHVFLDLNAVTWLLSPNVEVVAHL